MSKFKTSSYNLKLTRQELIHLRDLFSILLPPDGESTISEQLAIYKDRENIEHQLWQKLCDLCSECNISIENKAPDFIVTLSSTPNFTIVEIPKTFEENNRRIQQNKRPNFGEDQKDVNNKELFDMITLKKA